MPLSELQRTILESLEESGPATPRQLVRRITEDSGVSVEFARDAIWRMLDEGSLSLTPQAELAARSTRAAV
jgi:hypothetical protein